jgi:hypothetical protein
MEDITMVRRFVLTVVMLGLCGTLAFAQVFPERENLDVVYISDGSVLRGKIIENFIDRYVKIEIYGGTTFVIAYENIDAIEEEPNPDYNLQWIRVEIGDLSGQLGDGGENADPGAAPRERGEFLGDGSFATLYGGLAWVQFDGSDWNDSLDSVDARDERGTSGTIGLSYAFFSQARPDVAPWWVWGLRTGLGYAWRETTVDILDPSGGVDRREYLFRAHILELPAEFLLGGGGDRIFWYFGGGFGVSLLLGEPQSEFDGQDVGHPSGDETQHPIQAFVRGTTGTYFRLGSSDWVGDVRLVYDQNLTGSWYDNYDQYYRSFTVGVGAGYHF